MELSSGWSYRWIPADAEEAWAQGDSLGSLPWEALETRGVPPRREGSSLLQMRLVLPRKILENPALFLKRVNGVFSLHLGGEELYRYGPEKLDQWKRADRFPWQTFHMISLPDKWGGQILTMNLYTPFPVAGIDGIPLLGDRGDLFVSMFRTNLPLFMMGILVLFVGILGFIFILVIIMLDIDFFRLYNDRYGHLRGDVCLTRISRIMEEELSRPGDFLFRYGGEEFSALSADTDEKGLRRVAERLRQRVEEEAIPSEKSLISSVVTIRVGGYSAVPAESRGSRGPVDLVKRADENLYRAKKGGRNRVVATGGPSE